MTDDMSREALVAEIRRLRAELEQIRQQINAKTTA